uniref:Putative secreted protein n=1 Tax=Ixodes ricinus TaxID=34613 RepID=A0A6B0UQB5_IXORI
MLPMAAILAASQLQWWVWQTPVLLQVSLLLDSPQKLRQPGVATPRRQRHSRSLMIFADISTPNRQDRDILQHDTPVSVTSFFAISGPVSMHGENTTLHTPAADAFHSTVKVRRKRKGHGERKRERR